MKQIKYIGLLVFSFFILETTVKASHIIGGEITYRCLGNGQFEVTLDVFRDCFYGIANFDNPAAVGIYNEDSLLQVLNLSPISIDSLPTDLNDICLEVPPDVCVDWARYQGVVTLDASLVKNEGFTFVYQRCCRNETITNIIEPDKTGATYFVNISLQSYNECNSSPTFTQNDTTFTYPPVFVCVGKPIIYDHSATDTDGDSLVYKLCTPFKGASFGFSQPPIPAGPPYESINWNSPFYDETNMLGSSPALAIDSETGLLTGFPTTIGQFVVGVCVEEYRNGVLLSTVRRDFQYNVGMCLELIADFEGPEAQCDNLTVQFENTSNMGDNFIWYPEFPRMDIVSTAENLTYTYPDTGSYTVCLINEPFSQCADTLCKPLFLQFNSIDADFGFSTFDCQDSSVVVLQDLSIDTVSPIVAWEWEISYNGVSQSSTEQNPTFIVPNPSSGTILLRVRSQNGCESTHLGTFQTNLNNPTNLISPFLQVCKGDSIGLNPNLIGQNDFTFTWGTPINNMDINPMVAPDTTTTYTVTISAFNGLCSSDYDITVQVLDLPILDFEFESDCDATTVSFTNMSQNAFSYTWDFGDGSPISNSFAPDHPYADTGIYTITLATAATNLCQDTLVRDITLGEKILIADFDYEYESCETDEIVIQFQEQSINNINNTSFVRWFFGPFGQSNQPDPKIVVTSEQSFEVTMIVITTQNCRDTITKVIDVDFIEYDFTDSVQICWNETMELNPNGSPDYEYLWLPNIGLDDNTKPNPIANPQQSTTYTVQITNISADTCEITRTVDVFVPTPIDLDAGEDILTCEETIILNATSSVNNVTYTWQEQQNQIIGNEANLTVNVSGINTYTVEGTDEFGCVEADQIIVSGGPVDADIAGEQIKCTNETVDIFLNNMDPNDTLNIIWSPLSAFLGDPTNDPNPDLVIVPGAQTIYVEAENQFGCSLQDSVFVALVDSNINLDFDFQVGCSGATVEFFNQSTNAFNYVWDFGTGATSTLENPVYTFPDTGTYLVTLNIEFDVNCVEVAQKEVTILSPDFITDFTFEYVNCSTDEILIQFNDNSFNFLNNTSSWNWTFSNGETSNLPNPLISITENTNLTATLQIGTPNGCTGEATKELNIELIELNFDNEQTLCIGDSIPLNPNGHPNYIYQWSPTDGLSDATNFNPIAFVGNTTNYQVSITNISADTCTIQSNVLVTVPEFFDVTATGDTTTCGTPNTIQANATLSDIDFTWSNLNGDLLANANSYEVNPNEAITLILTGMDESMCVNTDTITIYNESIHIEVDFKGEACPDDTIQIFAANGIPNHTLDIIWEAIPPTEILGTNNGQMVTAVTAPPGQNSIFVLSTVNQFNCNRTDTITVFSHPFFPTFESEILACPNVETALNPNANPTLTYSWLPPNSVSNPQSPNPTGIFSMSTDLTVLISEVFGNEVCEVYADVAVEVPPVIVTNIPRDTSTCGQPIEICADLNVDATLQWADSLGNIIEGTNCIEVNPMADEFYILTAVDAAECSSSDTVFINNNAVDLSIIGDGSISTCPQDSLLIFVMNLDVEDTLTYEWTAIDNGTILNNEDTNAPWVATIPNTFATFEVNASNQFGCETIEQVVVQTYEFTAAVDDTIRVCENIPTPLNPNFTEGLVYEWSPAIFLDNPNSPNPTVTISETTIFNVTIMSFNELDTCMATREVMAIVNPAIELTPNPDSINLCEFMEITLTANTNASASIEWSNDSGFTDIIGINNAIQVNPAGTTSYYVRATDGLGCQEIDTVIINTFPLDIALPDIHNFCIEKEVVEIEVINNDPLQILSFNWFPADIIINGGSTNNPIGVAVENDQWLYVEVTNQFGCTIIDSTLIQFFDLNSLFGEATAEPDTIIFGAENTSQLDIDVIPDVFYEWSPSGSLDFADIPNPIASPEETTLYTVDIFNTEGCATARDVEVFVKEVICDEPFIFIPSAFSPNNDGENDVLYVRGIGLDEVELVIFNRWGQRVFSTNDQSVGWNGTFKGEFLAPDVYGYFLNVRCFNGENYFKKGNVSLLR